MTTKKKDKNKRMISSLIPELKLKESHSIKIDQKVKNITSGDSFKYKPTKQKNSIMQNSFGQVIIKSKPEKTTTHNSDTNIVFHA